MKPKVFHDIAHVNLKRSQRQALEAMARQEERSLSSMIRLLIVREAQQRGLLPEEPAVSAAELS